eukprot:5261728-Pyramimonas_sp.AAC.1
MRGARRYLGAELSERVVVKGQFSSGAGQFSSGGAASCGFPPPHDRSRGPRIDLCPPPLMTPPVPL